MDIIISLIAGGVIGGVISYYFYRKSTKDSEKANKENTIRFNKTIGLADIQIEFLNQIANRETKWNAEKLSEGNWKIHAGEDLCSKIVVKSVNQKSS
ncbi:hypothetical protein LGL08_20000 [Clostridium estertheticum]|uniref:hypothetical protein n=1 Tax=Clostridium estertheticum TaxID=238834 RepID=UPI001CF402F2|nr:hypothetical protein [Clostridium estertheticum]MCB2308988.1 hypothetical protein [Clostridium estertheticum]MCB2346878.1 hypothetical protein [Clostridium estertheticum]MCB2351810.1 hypothetical protein [Clostridium estertheticum]WAG48414.1 hypothetical protein LL127_22805 [Clostridium estertheticum]